MIRDSAADRFKWGTSFSPYLWISDAIFRRIIYCFGRGKLLELQSEITKIVRFLHKIIFEKIRRFQLFFVISAPDLGQLICLIHKGAVKTSI